MRCLFAPRSASSRCGAAALTLALAVAAFDPLQAQRDAGTVGEFPSDGPSNASSTQPIIPRIAWYGRLDDGLEQARRSGRPILLVSAAPQCEGVPGMW